MPTAPDIPGFADAQNRLRQQLGVDAVFLIRVPAVYPAGTQLDDDGTPFDPTVEPESGGDFATMTKRCSIVQGMLRMAARGRDESADRPAGIFQGETIVLGLASTDKVDVEDASEVVAGSITYAITDLALDPAFNIDARWLVFGEAK